MTALLEKRQSTIEILTKNVCASDYFRSVRRTFIRIFGIIVQRVHILTAIRGYPWGHVSAFLWAEYIRLSVEF